MLERFKQILQEAASIAARRFRAGAAVPASRKADQSLVTDADLEINAFLRDRLGALVPEAAWLSEEEVDDRRRLSCELVWIVDPLDGTKEFASGVPEFAVSAALVKNGLVALAGVVNPAQDQGGVGGPDGVEFWGLPVAAPVAAFEDLSVCVSRTERERQPMGSFIKRFRNLRAVGSAAYKLLRVAAGADHLSFSLESRSEWDVCGGAGLLAFAGKDYRRFDGKPVLFNQAHVRIQSGTVSGSAEWTERFVREFGPFLSRDGGFV